MRVTMLSTLCCRCCSSSGPSDAQTSRQPRDARAQQLSVDAIEARERCSQQARLEVPVLTDDERSEPEQPAHRNLCELRHQPRLPSVIATIRPA